MSARELPARPHLDHLKHEAKALHKAWQASDPIAVQRVHDEPPRPPSVSAVAGSVAA